VLLQLRSLTAPDNEERDCTGVALPALSLEWQRTAAVIPVELSVVWAKRSSPLIAAAIASPAVLLVVLLSLLLLRLVNERWMRPPDASGLWGYEGRGTLTLDRRGRPRIEWERGTTAFRVEQDAIGPVTGIGREELRLEGTRLVRRMPGWLRPLDEPVLAHADAEAVAAHPPASRGRGTLPLGFREAVVVAADSVRVPTVDDPLPVRVVVLVPRSSDVAVSDAVETLVEQRIDPLAERLYERLRELTGGADRDAGHGGGPSGPGGPGGPEGPSGPSGPGGPSGRPGGDDGWGAAPSASSRPAATAPPSAPPASPAPSAPSERGRARRGPSPVSASERAADAADAGPDVAVPAPPVPDMDD